MVDIMYNTILPLLLWGLLVYIYILIVLKLKKLAIRFGIEDNLWLLWIPILNGYIIHKMADSKLWTFIASIFFFVPFVNLLSYFIPAIWYWKIAKKLDYPGWWGLIWPMWLTILDIETED